VDVSLQLIPVGDTTDREISNASQDIRGTLERLQGVAQIGIPTIVRAEIAPTGSDKRPRPAEARAGPSNSVPASGDAMAEAFRRAGLTGKAPGRR
jgi:hypothetical protein